MQVYISNKEIEESAQSLVQISCGNTPPKQIDIDAVAEYLGLPVVYERFAEDDQDKIGFVSDGRYPLNVYRNGQKRKVAFPKDTIVLEKFLLQPEETARRRFVLAHEISHVLIGRADPIRTAACFNRVFDAEQTYGISELHKRMSLEECQANAMAALLLMPYELLTSAVHRHLHREKIPIYGNSVFLPTMKPTLKKMSEELGVSYTAMLIQLKKYDLLEQREMQEYFQATMQNGGECDADRI